MGLQSQGGIEDGEEPKCAAIRELREETGIVSVEIIAEVCAEKKVPVKLQFAVPLVLYHYGSYILPVYVPTCTLMILLYSFFLSIFLLYK